MKNIPLKDGGTMPALGFGTWQLRKDSCYQAVKDALQAGYRHIDTACIYGNERDVGKAIAHSGVPRRDTISVFFRRDRSGKRIWEMVEECPQQNIGKSCYL